MQNTEKACCDNQQWAFSCFGGKCAEPTKFTFHRQSIPPCRSSPTRKARGSNPPGRTNQEDNRAAVSERALREIYLRGFEIAVKESEPLALMTSYNKLNGTYSGCRHDLITDILRCEWGYKGLVMTDWGTQYDPAAALHAQVDLMMPGADADRDAVLTGLTDGSITPAEVRRAAARVLALIEKSLTAKL
ncbi:glycoside hydrolase family 3 N-terminal domain-containing protein [Faecalibacterium prausnitzii]